jgi:16S rRNA C967 or C1407 C5-methylase (RsmB/RsmF family)
VRWFLENFPEFELVDVWERLSMELAEKLREESAGVDESSVERGESRDALMEKCLQLLPGVHACDGFFIAVFVKKPRGARVGDDVKG